MTPLRRLPLNSLKASIDQARVRLRALAAGAHLVHLIVEGLLFAEGHDRHAPGETPGPSGRGVRPRGGGENAVGAVVGHQRQSQLLEIVAALRPPGGLPSGLNGRQQQRDQNADDGDDHQQLDQGKTASGPRRAAVPNAVDDRRELSHHILLSMTRNQGSQTATNAAALLSLFRRPGGKRLVGRQTPF